MMNYLKKNYIIALVTSMSISLYCVGQQADLMPMPSSIKFNQENYRLTDHLSVAVFGKADERLYKESSRFLQRLAERTGLFLTSWNVDKNLQDTNSAIQIFSENKGVVQLEMNESYNLFINKQGVIIKAESDIGAIRALETLLQLITSDKEGFYIKGVDIKDTPRIAWRGLLISQPYHFMPMDVIKRTLDAMAVVKMNVLHFYISDDQGYTIQSDAYPRLNQVASGGNFFTKAQVSEIIEYADQRGIRVVPEIDLPGHSTAIITAFPELASIKRNYMLQDHWGVFDPTIDPTKEKNYLFLDTLLTEVASMFKDKYFHIGGDENTGKDWAKNDSIKMFMKENNLPTTLALQTYFNRKIQQFLRRSNKNAVGWDEILMKEMQEEEAKKYFENGDFKSLIQNDLPKDIVIQSWRGMEALISSAKNGYKSILSKGYYIDLNQPTSYHYLNDPVPFYNQVIIPDSEANFDRFESDIIKKIKKGETILDTAEEKLIIGGEATMWTEHVSPETFDSRVWPRTAAIAERLWSPASIRDVDDMYRRLEIISIQLEWVGSTHIKNRNMMLRRIAGTENTLALEHLVDYLEPLKGYKRNEADNFTKHAPYSLLVDIAVPDPKALRDFNKLVDTLIRFNSKQHEIKLLKMLKSWKNDYTTIMQQADKNLLLKTALVHAENLFNISNMLEEFLRLKHINQKPSKTWFTKFNLIIKKASLPSGYCELMVLDSMTKLITAKNN